MHTLLKKHMGKNKDYGEVDLPYQQRCLVIKSSYVFISATFSVLWPLLGIASVIKKK